MNYKLKIRNTYASQGGVVLVIALIALVAITLAGLALMRSVDTGLVIAGNLAFKQSAVQGGDAGTEQAISWLSDPANLTLLVDDLPTAGYYSTWRKDLATNTGCDLLGKETTSTNDDVVWEPAGSPQAGCGMVAVGVASDSLADGYQASYVINRMCDSPGAPNSPGVYCSAYESSSSGSGSTQGGGSYGSTPLSGSTQQYYRVTTRVVGPRNTESFVQTIVAF